MSISHYQAIRTSVGHFIRINSQIGVPKYQSSYSKDETQSGPPDYDCCAGDGCGVICGELVVPHCDVPKVLEKDYAPSTQLHRMPFMLEAHF